MPVFCMIFTIFSVRYLGCLEKVGCAIEGVLRCTGSVYLLGLEGDSSARSFIKFIDQKMSFKFRKLAVESELDQSFFTTKTAINQSINQGFIIPSNLSTV